MSKKKMDVEIITPDMQEARAVIDSAENEMANIGRLRLRGKSFKEISESMQIDHTEVKRLYNKFLDLNRKDWLKSKGRTITEINEAFRQRMLRAESHYQDCATVGNQGGAAVWHKLILETIHSYMEFLKDIGYVTQASVVEIDETLANQTGDPLLTLINEQKKYLQKRIVEESFKPKEETK